MQVWRVIYGDSYGTRERKQAAHGTPSMFFRVISFFHRSRRCWGNINEGKCQCHFFLPSMESRYRVFRWKIVSLSRLTRWSSHIIRNNFVLHYHYLACIFSIHHFLVIIRMIVKRTLFRNRLFLVEFVHSWLLKRASNCKKKKEKKIGYSFRRRNFTWLGHLQNNAFRSRGNFKIELFQFAPRRTFPHYA